MSQPLGWQQVSFDEVVGAWLSMGGVQEGDKRGRTFTVPATPQERYQYLVDHGYLFLRFIPPCDWFRVAFTQPEQVLALRLIDEESWVHTLAQGARELGVRADLTRVTAPHSERVRELVGHADLTSLVEGRVVLFGHQAAGPLTILDGNHRLLALAHRLSLGGERLTPFHAFVGLSHGPCRWHGDPVEWVERPARVPGERRFILKVW
jgi:hypothetical protein